MLMRFVAWMVIAAVACAAEPNLLPQPKEARFGTGRLPLRGIAVGLTGAASAEDAVVLRRLESILGAAGIDVQRSGGKARILLQRTAQSSSWEWQRASGRDSAESYTIRIRPTGAEVKARTARGLFYAVQTVGQLIQGRGVEAWLPECDIADWPALRLRGFMLDISHGPFPTLAELKRHIDLLALWKANQFYLYSETNIELDGFPVLSPQTRLTKAQVRELIAYAKERFIDVVPCVELYGHLHDLVRLERYSELGETAHGGEVNPRDPRVHELVRNWVGQLAELFPSPFFHVGLDETYELGKMPGRELTPKDAGEIYLGFFEKISGMVAAKGKRVMVWADILLQHPEVIPRLPKGTIALPWRYQDQADFDSLVAPLAAAKVETVLGSGVWNYYEGAPDFAHTIGNVNGWMRSATKFGSEGLLHTEWTDSGQVFFNMADPAVAMGPVASWGGAPLNPADFYRSYSRLRHPRDAERVAAVLAAISEAQVSLESALGHRGMFALWSSPFLRASLDTARKNLDLLRKGRRRAEDAQELLYGMQSHDERLFRSLLYGARLLDYLALRYLYAVEMEDFYHALQKRPTRAQYRLLFGIESSDHTHSRAFDLMDAAGELRKEMEEMWLSQYAPYRLQTALGRWQAEFERWRKLQQRLNDGYRTFPEGGPVPAFDSLFSLD